MPGQFAQRKPPRTTVARGFTLIELMVTLTILGILTLLAAPSFNEAILGNKLAGFSNTFVASAQLARSEAIKRNNAVTLCRSADGQTCAASGTWQQGWIVMCKYKPAAPGMCVSDGTDNLVLSVQQALPGDFRFTEESDIYSLAFQPVGAGATSATLVLCRATPSPGAQERRISVSLTGRASVETTRTGTCT